MPKKKSTRELLSSAVLYLRTSPGIKVAVFFTAVVLLSSAVVLVIERGRDGDFVSFFDSFWWTIVTISTVGYGERVPDSVAGRAVALLTIVFGMALMGTVTGRIASFLMERQMKMEQGLLDHTKLKGHFIICGWKREMNRVLYNILENNPTLSPLEIVLLSKAPVEETNTVRNDPHLKGIKLVNGDFIEERDLKRAGIRGAARILVLADYYSQGEIQQIDSKTVMAVMSVKNLNRRAYVCAELLDTKFIKYLHLSHCDEILLSRDFSRAMLASASQGTGLSHVVSALLSEENAHIRTESFPDSFVGKSYGELREHFWNSSRAQLIGLLQNTGNIMSRKREALREAQKNPDISSLIPDLKEVKSLSANEPVINPPESYRIPHYTRGIVIGGGTGVPAG